MALVAAADITAAIGGTLGSANPALNANETTYITTIAAALSAFVLRHCNREFAQTTYDELYTFSDRQQNGGIILLKNYPVISIAFARANPNPCLLVSQTDSVTNQYTTVTALSTGLSLERIASGVKTTVTAGLTYAANLTLNAMAAAIIGVGSNWTAKVNAPFGLFPSTDLYISSLPLAPIACNSYFGTMRLHTDTLPAMTFDPPTGRLYPGWTRYEPWSTISNYFTYPASSIRVQYSAGYATIPTDLTQALATWGATIFFKSKRDPNTLNVIPSGATPGSSAFAYLENDMQPQTRLILNNYRQRKV